MAGLMRIDQYPVAPDPLPDTAVLLVETSPDDPARAYARAPVTTFAPGLSIRGGFFGFGQARNGTTSLDVGAGWCAADDGSSALALATTLTKTQGAWVAGNNAGGLDSGTSYAASTWYYVFCIGRSDTGATDVLFSASATIPTLPAGYDKKRRIGAFLTTGAGLITPFVNQGDYWFWSDAVNDLDTTAPGTSWTAVAVTAPRIPGVIIFGRATVRNTAAVLHAVGFASGVASVPSDRFLGDFEIANSTPKPADPNNSQVNTYFQLMVNASGQVYYFADSTTSIRVFLTTRGYIDVR